MARKAFESVLRQRVIEFDYAHKEDLDEFLALPARLESLADSFASNPCLEHVVIRTLLLKLKESVQATIVLLSLNLFEDLAASLRKCYETTAVFLHTAGKGCFSDYAEGKLFSQFRRNKAFSDQLPLRYGQRIEDLVGFLSKYLHARDGIASPHVTSQVRNEREFLDSRRFFRAALQGPCQAIYMSESRIFEPICNLYLNTNPGDPRDLARLAVFNYLMSRQDLLEKFFVSGVDPPDDISWRAMWDHFMRWGRKKSTQSSLDFWLIHVDSEEVKQYLTMYPEIRPELVKLFGELTWGVWISTR